MTSTTRTVIAVVFLTMVAAGVGFGIGSGLNRNASRHAQSLDEILHHELNLTPEQEKKIAGIEAKFALDREDLEAQMRAANRELARALEREPVYGDQARKAISQFHDAMLALQEKTIIHILEMRSVLTPEQTERFDTSVRQALSSGSH